MLAPLVTRFVTVSADLRSWLVEYVGIPAAKVTTIYNGVDTARFAEGGREVGRHLLGVGDDAVVFGSVGRLDPVKDHVGLLDAFARADLSGVQAHLVIVGDGPCRGELAERCRQPDLAGRARLLGARDDVASLLRGMDVYVLPSIAEGISNTILEAMACGLPVVATRTGGNPELVQDGVTGALVPVGDRAALARALGAFAEDSHFRSTRGKAGRQRAVEEFGMDRMASRYRELYREVSTRGRGVRRPER
jgi:sugar transferase (PEP-CTERM/EpsH1 system associated)